MEFTTQKPQFDNAIGLLEANMKKKNKALPAEYRKKLIALLKKHEDLMMIKGKRFVISVQFYSTWIKEFNLDKSGKLVDAGHYKFFRKLRKYKYIHSASSYFPKKLAVITLNPTLPSTYKGNIGNITSYTRGKESLYKVSSSSHNKIDAYIDLRLYQSFMLTSKEIESINTSNIVYIDESIAYVYIEDKGIFDNVKIPPYHLIPIRGSKLINILKQCKEDKIIHPFANTDMENQLLKHKQEFFSGMSFYEIRMAAQNHMLVSSNSLETTLQTSRKILSPVTLAELHSLYPSVVPQHLFEIEKNRICDALDRTHDIDIDEENYIDSSFDLKEFDYFQELLQAKNNSLFMKKIEPAKRELLQYVKSNNAEAHGILICKYIVHLLESIHGNKEGRNIAISTFRNYYSLVKKHLFENIEDLSRVQTHEINTIIQNLAINKYKDKSIAKVKSLISDFFRFHGEQHNIIQMKLASYPKSLVLTSEIDQILTGIENMYANERQRTNPIYTVLRDKAILLMARYTGLRKSELRSRLMKDVYIYGNELCIDINSKGLRKLDLRLKTGSAKRRVCSKITNEDHLQIIIEYMGTREKVRNKNPFLFLHVDEKNNIKSKVVKEDVFNQIGKIIQEVTNRYTSFHSLRHTYATYAVRDILQCNKIDPYKMIDLSVKMGHTSPEITLKKYTHRSVVEKALNLKDER